MHCAVSVAAGSTPWTELRELPELESGLLRLGHKRESIIRVFREMQKHVAYANRETLYTDLSKASDIRRENDPTPEDLRRLAYVPYRPNHPHSS